MFALNKKIILLTFLLIFIFLSQTFAETDQNLVDATKQIKRFVDLEFNGDGCARDEADLVQYDKAVQTEIKKNQFGACIFLNAEPLIVVGNYDIKSVQIFDNRGIAIVTFRRLAKTQGLGDKTGTPI